MLLDESRTVAGVDPQAASLFAGKLHALLARAYLNRVKGRDYYDFLFYAARDTAINMAYLEAKLHDSGHYAEEAPLDRNRLIDMLVRKFESVDFDKARTDVRPYLLPGKVASLSDWDSELFIAIAQDLRSV